MALGSTQPLTEIGTWSISWWGKGGRCVRLWRHVTISLYKCIPFACLAFLELTFVWPTVRGTVISVTNKMEQNLFCWFFYACCTCFGRQFCPSSGALWLYVHFFWTTYRLCCLKYGVWIFFANVSRKKLKFHENQTRLTGALPGCW